VVRRVIPSDNSCLFTAVGYVMENDRGKAAQLRRVIADAVAADPGALVEVHGRLETGWGWDRVWQEQGGCAAACRCSDRGHRGACSVALRSLVCSMYTDL
jgi:ubiquitin thioesterase OTU1